MFIKCTPAVRLYWLGCNWLNDAGGGFNVPRRWSATGDCGRSTNFVVQCDQLPLARLITLNYEEERQKVTGSSLKWSVEVIKSLPLSKTSSSSILISLSSAGGPDAMLSLKKNYKSSHLWKCLQIHIYIYIYNVPNTFQSLENASRVSSY